MSEDSRQDTQLAHEMKFLLPASRAEEMRQWAREHLGADPHGGGIHGDEYRTTTIYFDTEAHDTFHRRGSYGRSKFRVRRYGDSEIVFLERKRKARGLVSKRRSTVPLLELDVVTAALGGIPATSEWGAEWFTSRLVSRRLRPVCVLSYERTARVNMTPFGLIRMTIDQNLRAMQHRRVSYPTDRGVTVLASDVILELKYCMEMPAVFRGLVEDFALSPAPISKYRMSAALLGFAQEDVTACPTS